MTSKPFRIAFAVSAAISVVLSLQQKEQQQLPLATAFCQPGTSLSCAQPSRQSNQQRKKSNVYPFFMSSSGGNDGSGIGVAEPTTFREAEVIGLRFMQEGRHEDALKAFKMAMKLPGSRPDVVRTKMLSGPSPVGGAQGGTEGKIVMNLDEFEAQAAHYNIACANARLGNIAESIANLKLAFDCGFDNYATVRSDPDLADVQSTPEFDNLMHQYDKRFRNPLNMFGRK